MMCPYCHKPIDPHLNEAHILVCPWCRGMVVVTVTVLKEKIK